MIDVLMTEYWSRADAFLLPLTGLSNEESFELKSYLFWNEYSIEDYKLIVSLSCENYEEMVAYCRRRVFPILDRNGYLVENYDVEGRSIFILDMSEWAMDIQMFLAGKYSRMSKEAKMKIEKFHRFDGNKIPIHIFAVLYPNMPMKLLDDMTPIQYISERYEMPLEVLERIGEVGSVFDRMSETILTDVSEICGK
jgi:hypothetical protein